jgi:hypothetical protein
VSVGAADNTTFPEPVVAANLAVVIVPSVISIAAIVPSAIEAPIICETAICYLFFL